MFYASEMSRSSLPRSTLFGSFAIGAVAFAAGCYFGSELSWPEGLRYCLSSKRQASCDRIQSPNPLADQQLSTGTKSEKPSTVFEPNVHIPPLAIHEERCSYVESLQEVDDEGLVVHREENAAVCFDKLPETRDDSGDDEMLAHTSSRSSDTTDKEESDSENEFESFGPVIRSLDLKALAVLALHHRKSLAKSSKKLTCRIEEEMQCGSYNLVYTIIFSDDVKWVARIPGNGHAMRGLDIEKLDSEYSTMRYIQRKTFLPMPEVLYWTTDIDEIGSAFALLSYIEGTAVCDLWNDQHWKTEPKRLKVLENIASAMNILYGLQFDKIGMLEFDDEGLPTGVGPDIFHLPDYETEDVAPWGRMLINGSHETLGSFLHSPIDDEGLDDHTQRGQCTRPIQRLMLNSIPDYMSNSPYALAHADFNWQNIFIDPTTCEVTGIIDWDNVSVQPVSLGCARYPSWITRDWDPAMYHYGADYDDIDEDYEEDTPEELSKYRQHYVSCWQAFHKAQEHYDPRYTRLSHILEAIKICRFDGISSQYIFELLLYHGMQDQLNFKIYDYANAWMQNTTAEFDVRIKAGFENMWYAEWDSPVDSSPATAIKQWYAEVYKAEEGRYET